MNDQTKPQFQSPEWIIPKIQRDFSRNKNKSISAAFRHYRNHKNLSLIGDYPILATIVYIIRDIGIEIKRQKLFYAFNQSTELKSFPRNDKQQLIEQLLNPSSVQFSKDNTHARIDFSLREDTLPIQVPLF